MGGERRVCEFRGEGQVCEREYDHTYMYGYVYLCRYINIYMCMCAHMLYSYVDICTYEYICMKIYRYIKIYTCTYIHTYILIYIHTYMLIFSSYLHANIHLLMYMRVGGLGSRPKKMYGERLGDGVEYHLMKPTPRR